MSMRPTDHIVSRTTEAVVVLSEFDGVHRSHAALVGAALQHARSLGATLVAVVADRGEGVPRIMHVNRRCELLLSIGVSSAFVAPLPHPVAVQDALGPTLERLRPVAVFLDAASWPSQPRNRLSQYLRGLGSVVRDGPTTAGPGFAPIDTAAVIGSLDRGDIRTAEAMLGRPYELSGAVAARVLVSRSTRFQTEQLATASDVVLPKRGVYIARALIGRRWIAAAVDVRTGPSFDSSQGGTVVEAHLIDFEGDVQNTELSLRFVRRLRDQVQFGGPDDITAQLDRDVVAAIAELRPEF